MSVTPGHPGDELQLLIDGRLDVERRAAVEAHAASCARCRRELTALRRLKAAVREGLPQHPVPPSLMARVSSALAAETARRGWRRRPLVIGVALAAAAALILLLARPARPDLLAAAAGDFAAFRAATLRLELETADPAALQRHITSAQLPFPARVFDFGMMGYQLTGGGAHRLAGRISALFAYQSASGERVLCQMYQGQVAELPAPPEERQREDGMRFLIYRVGGLTLVFWQEGVVVCVLMAEGDAEVAIQLAYAKAVKV